MPTTNRATNNTVPQSTTPDTEQNPPDDTAFVTDCQNCRWGKTYDGSPSKTPCEQAKTAVGGHRAYNPEHEVKVYPEGDPDSPEATIYGQEKPPGERKNNYPSEEDIDRLYYGTGAKGEQRRLHTTDECDELKKVNSFNDCPATHPPRGKICEVCGPSLTVADLQQVDS